MALRSGCRLDILVELRGAHRKLRIDNGPKFISTNLNAWCKDNNVVPAFIQPGKLAQNAYIERFNLSYR